MLYSDVDNANSPTKPPGKDLVDSLRGWAAVSVLVFHTMRGGLMPRHRRISKS